MDQARTGFGRESTVPCASSRWNRARGFECDICDVGHRNCRAVAGRAAGKSDGFVAEYQADSDFWTWLRGRSCWHFPGSGLREGVSEAGSATAVRRALLIDAAARRFVHGALDFSAAVWRWSGRDGRIGSERKSNGPEILATKSILYPNTER